MLKKAELNNSLAGKLGKSKRNWYDGSYTKTIDLTSSTYDTNTLYPVVSSNDFSSSWGVHVVCYNDTGTSATWSTHKSKQYRAICDLIYKGSQWGWATEYLYVIDHSFQQCSTTPISVVPVTTTMQLIFYLRGGGKYYIDTPSDMSWTIKTSTYTTNNESFPLKSYNDTSLMNVGQNGREDSIISSSNPGKPHAVKQRIWYNTGTRV